jgi:hypothetical protein
VSEKNLGDTKGSRVVALFHDFLVLDGVANVDVRLVRQLRNCWIQVHHVDGLSSLVQMCVQALCTTVARTSP